MNNETMCASPIYGEKAESMLDKAIAWQSESLEDLRTIRADITAIADALAARAPSAPGVPCVMPQISASAGKLVKLRDTQDTTAQTVRQIEEAIARLRELL